MKKVWNTPNIKELTIQSTACWNKGWNPSGPSGYSGSKRPSRPSYPTDIPGCGNWPSYGPEDETSSF